MECTLVAVVLVRVAVHAPVRVPVHVCVNRTAVRNAVGASIVIEMSMHSVRCPVVEARYESSMLVDRPRRCTSHVYYNRYDSRTIGACKSTKHDNTRAMKWL